MEKETPNNAKSSQKIAALATLAIGAAALVGLNYISDGQPSLAVSSNAHAREGISIPAPKNSLKEASGVKTAVFAGGCFWGIEAIYERVEGVISAETGYSGGNDDDATYDLVSYGQTRHAESVRIRYDSSKVSYNQLLHIFFSVAHDPTQLNRQGPDVGAQYRTAIFPVDTPQRKAAKAYIKQLNKAKIWDKPIATTIENNSFYAAENYHQDFMARNPNHPYIVHWDWPKVRNLERLFPDMLKKAEKS